MNLFITTLESIIVLSLFMTCIGYNMTYPLGEALIHSGLTVTIVFGLNIWLLIHYSRR